MSLRSLCTAPPTKNNDDEEIDVDDEEWVKKRGPKKPSMEEALAAPRHYCEYSNEMLLILAAEGDHDASSERLIREIMWEGQISWDEAQPQFDKVKRSNEGIVRSLTALPFKINATVAIVVGFATIPLCFDLPTAMWFNDAYVTTEVPPDEDLETMLEVGGWTWNWMEPPLGQASFLLLCIEFARRQMDHLGIQPYVNIVKSRRIKSLQDEYPQYNKNIIGRFAETSPLS